MMRAGTRGAGLELGHSSLQPAYKAEGVLPIFRRRILRLRETNSQVMAEVGLRLVLQLQDQYGKWFPARVLTPHHLGLILLFHQLVVDL